MVKTVKSIVYIKNNEVLVGTDMLSKGFGVEHRALKRLVVKYKKEFDEWGFVATPLLQIGPKKRGRQLEEYELNEQQAAYLSTLLTNNDTVRKFKHKLVDAFFKQRKLLQKIISQKQNAEWLEKREAGKLERKEETDSVKEFVAYCKEHGSSNADKYFVLLSKMVNKALFSIEQSTYKQSNTRDLLDHRQLTTLENADLIVARTLKEGMAQQMPYKDIYQLAKLRIETFAELVGKSPLQEVLQPMLALDESARLP